MELFTLRHTITATLTLRHISKKTVQSYYTQLINLRATQLNPTTFQSDLLHLHVSFLVSIRQTQISGNNRQRDLLSNRGQYGAGTDNAPWMASNK